MNIPSLIYKYLPVEGALKTLENCSIRVTPPNELNDPFECMPCGYDGLSPQMLMSNYKDKLLLDKYCFYYNSRMKTNYTPAEWREMITNMPEEALLSFFNKICKGLNNRDWRGWVNSLSKRYGISSFSESYDTVTMWAHYAENHNGLVISFHSDEFSQLLYPVKYLDSRIKVLPSNVTTMEARRNVLMEIMTTKKRIWENEREWRLISVLSTLTSKDNIFLFPFNINAIDSLYFGVHRSDDFFYKCLRLLDSHKATPKLYQMKLNTTSGTLQPELLAR